MRVLCIEDHPGQAFVNRSLLSQRLGPGNVLHATDVDGGMQLICSGPLSGMLSDWHLGDHTAAELVRAFRVGHPHGLCVVYSSDDSAREEALSCGAHRFFVKTTVQSKDIVYAFARALGVDT